MEDNHRPIMVPYGVMRRLQREGLGTQPTLRKALRGEYNEDNTAERTLALRIRIRALRLGGSFANPEPVTRNEEKGGRQ